MHRRSNAGVSPQAPRSLPVGICGYSVARRILGFRPYQPASAVVATGKIGCRNHVSDLVDPDLTAFSALRGGRSSHSPYEPPQTSLATGVFSVAKLEEDVAPVLAGELSEPSDDCEFRRFCRIPLVEVVGLARRPASASCRSRDEGSANASMPRHEFPRGVSGEISVAAGRPTGKDALGRRFGDELHSAGTGWRSGRPRVWRPAGIGEARGPSLRSATRVQAGIRGAGPQETLRESIMKISGDAGWIDRRYRGVANARPGRGPAGGRGGTHPNGPRRCWRMRATATRTTCEEARGVDVSSQGKHEIECHGDVSSRQAETRVYRRPKEPVVKPRVAPRPVRRAAGKARGANIFRHM